MLLVLAWLPTMPTAARAGEYTVQAVARYSGSPVRLNAYGHVVGLEGDAYLNPVRAFVWDPGRGAQTLPSPKRRCLNAGATAINVHDVIAGSIADNCSASGTWRPVYWRRGRLHRLPQPDGAVGGSFPLAINPSGQMAGCGFFGAEHRLEPVVWSNGRVGRLPMLTRSAEEGCVAASAARDVFVGWSSRAGIGRSYAVIWRSGRIHPLGVLPGDTESSAFAINGAGRVVGWSINADAGVYHPVIFDHGTVRKLPGCCGAATAINRHGTIVGGFANHGDGEAVLWRHGVLVDLQTRIGQRSPWRLLGADDINSAGQIAGSAERRSDGSLWYVVLTPRHVPLAHERDR